MAIAHVNRMNFPCHLPVAKQPIVIPCEKDRLVHKESVKTKCSFPFESKHEATFIHSSHCHAQSELNECRAASNMVSNVNVGERMSERKERLIAHVNVSIKSTAVGLVLGYTKKLSVCHNGIFIQCGNSDEHKRLAIFSHSPWSFGVPFIVLYRAYVSLGRRIQTAKFILRLYWCYVGNCE